jgi:hypothetical protein
MSGTHFRIEPSGLSASANATVLTRRSLALARGLGCQLIEGKLGLSGDRLGLEVTSVLAPRTKRPAENQAISSVDLDWLKWVPGGDLVAVVSVATGQGAAYWDEAFAVADRVDRADPVRANLAPLRTRLNLLATAVGTQLEADLWPHLRGLTLGLLLDPLTPSQPAALLALHMDQEASSRHILVKVLPRLAVLWGGTKAIGKNKQTDPANALGEADLAAPRSLGRVSGRPLEAAVRGKTVLIGWGQGVLGAGLEASAHPENSAVRWFKAMSGETDKKLPDRVGAFWPGRMRLPVRGLDGPTPLARCLAEGPPILWTGWTKGDLAEDRLQYAELRPLVRRFLAAIPLDPNPAR